MVEPALRNAARLTLCYGNERHRMGIGRFSRRLGMGIFVSASVPEPKGTAPKEALMECKRGHTRWLDWDKRHTATEEYAKKHGRSGDVYCSQCPYDGNWMFYTGRFRMSDEST